MLKVNRCRAGNSKRPSAILLFFDFTFHLFVDVFLSDLYFAFFLASSLFFLFFSLLFEILSVAYDDC